MRWVTFSSSPFRPVLGGANNFVEIGSWAKAKQEWLQQHLPPQHGIPSHDTFGRVQAGEDLRGMFPRMDDEGVLARPIQHWQCQSRAKEHGRLEIRRCFVVEARTAWLTEDQLSAWSGLSCVACVESERTIRGKATIEQCYFLTSLSLTGEKGRSIAREVLRGVRSHWVIENNLHKKTAQAVSLTGF